MTTKILLVEDDYSLRTGLTESLVSEGFDITAAENLTDARAKNILDFDLILLDWMLPDGQGIDFLKEVKAQTKVPVIMLTARTDLIDKVIGLESGANDYITKPFESRELTARIRVQLRDNTKQSFESEAEELSIGLLKMNSNLREVTYKNEVVILTKMEFDLIYLLASNTKQVFSREKLLDKVWGYDNYPTTRTVDTHVLQLRQKLSNDIIDTIRGVGYRFNAQHS